MSTERTLTDFVRALRSADVAVSPAEAIDAARAMALVGYGDRSRLKEGLRPVLAKSLADQAAYDRLFDLFFSRRAPHRPDAQDAAGPEQGDTASDPGDTGGDTPQGTDGGPPPDLLDLSETGDETAIAMAMERAGREAGVDTIRFSTQTAYFAQKMMQALGVERLETRLLDKLQEHSADGDAEAERLMQARRDMLARARQHVERQFEVFGTGATQQFREDFLGEKRISALDRSDIRRMQTLIEKLAKRLAVKHSRRRRRKNRGQIDIRRTLRRNAGLGGVPMELHWKQKRRDRPKIICICDVSNSVARYVRFLLLFLHSLQDVVPDMRAYAFSARLGDVTDWLDTEGFEAAMERILRDFGMGSTDYGQALSDMKVGHWTEIDRRATLIILGDGRSNHGDPRIDLFREASARAKLTIWLSPEPEPLWGTGDSELLRYRPYCDTLAVISTLKDLERAVDDVLAGYA